MGNEAGWVIARMTGLAGPGRSIGPVEEALHPELVGIKAFVEGALPGDLVRADLVSRKGQFVEGTLAELIEPSPHRREPPCPVATECGGCDLQSLTYEGQLAAKREMIVGAFRAARLGEVADRVRAFEPSSQAGYRRRFAFHIDCYGAVGLYRRRSRTVLPLSRCFVATKEVNIILEGLPLVAEALKGIPATALVESAEGEAGIALVVAESMTRERIEQVESALSSLTPVWSLKVKERIARNPTHSPLTLNAAGQSVSLPLGSFSQVNWEVNQRLVSRILSLVEAAQAQQVLDLYAGAGNFAIPIAARGIKTTAVELVPDLVRAGRMVAQSSELPLTYHCASVEKFLREVGEKKGNNGEWDCLVVDPPRSGLGALVTKLPRAPLVLLVSCQVSSCVRDVAGLSARGYEVESVEPYDMFAHTSHAEVLSVLRLREHGEIRSESPSR